MNNLENNTFKETVYKVHLVEIRTLKSLCLCSHICARVHPFILYIKSKYTKII